MNEDNKSGRETVAIIISVIALVVSIWSVVSTNKTTEHISENEIKQEHEAELKIWNQEISFNVYSNRLITDTIRLSYSNIGDGIAQDIRFEISPDEQKSIAIQCESILDSCLTYPYNQTDHTFDYSHFLSPRLIGDTSFSFWHDEFGGEVGELKNVMISGESIDLDSTLFDNKAYLLPVLSENEEAYFTIPEQLSVLILNTLSSNEFYKGSPQSSISFKATMSYMNVFNELEEKHVTIDISALNDGEEYFDKLEEDMNDSEFLFNLRLHITVQQEETLDEYR